MKRFALLLTLASALLGLAACDRTPDAADATLPPPPTAATEALLLPTPISGATALATSIFATVAVATATESALATVAATATAEPPTDEPPTDEPPTDEPPTNEPPTDESATVTATAETTAAVASPTAAAGTLFAPGQVDGATLAAGAAVSYQVQGQRFAPVILFVEPENNLDVALAAYSGDLSGQTTPEVTALAAADNALAGRPEILVLSPESDGLFTFVIRAASGEGSFAAHLFDLTTPAPGVVIQQPDILAAGTEKVYSVTSRGARPVIAVVDPTDQSDLALDVMGADNALLTTANYGGLGGAETAYVLPLGTVAYSLKIREVNSGPAAFQILVIAME
ncbi:MAG: hypothetical protein KA170_10565 [Candidatus Promineofilum sp.]|nr:hypothetical protein [Promineifilum sp.]